MRKRLYYYPPLRGRRYGHPYSANFREALSRRFRIVNLPLLPQCGLCLSFLFASFRADVYVINRLEEISFRRLGHWQFALAKLGLWIIRQRGKKVVWMFHRQRPREGHTIDTRWLHRYLFRHAQLIITHSQETTSWVRRQADGRVEYIDLPPALFDLDDAAARELPIDPSTWDQMAEVVARFVAD